MTTLAQSPVEIKPLALRSSFDDQAGFPQMVMEVLADVTKRFPQGLREMFGDGLRAKEKGEIVSRIIAEIDRTGLPFCSLSIVVPAPGCLTEKENALNALVEQGLLIVSENGPRQVTISMAMFGKLLQFCPPQGTANEIPLVKAESCQPAPV